MKSTRKQQRKVLDSNMEILQLKHLKTGQISVEMEKKTDSSIACHQGNIVNHTPDK